MWWSYGHQVGLTYTYSGFRIHNDHTNTNIGAIEKIVHTLYNMLRYRYEINNL